MKVVCTNCNATFSIPENKIPKKRMSAKCKKCGGQFVIEPGMAKPFEDAGENVSASLPEPKPGLATASKESARKAILLDYPEHQDLFSEKLALEEILAANKKGGYRTRDNSFKLKVIKATCDELEKILKEFTALLFPNPGYHFYSVVGAMVLHKIIE